jgi:hypothetical protein
LRRQRRVAEARQDAESQMDRIDLFLDGVGATLDHVAPAGWRVSGKTLGWKGPSPTFGSAAPP